MNDLEWFEKGKLLHQIGLGAEALKCFDHALSLNPKNELFWYFRGNSLRALGRHTEAIACYEESTSIDPYFADAWGNMGVSYGIQGKHADALRCFQRAIESTPNDAQWIAMTGSALKNLCRAKEAEEAYKRAESLDPRIRIRR